MSNRLHILMLSYVFPPAAGSGGFRTLYFSHHLSEMDAKVTVLTISKSALPQGVKTDESLLRKINPKVKIVRTNVMRPLDRVLQIREALRRAGPKDRNCRTSIQLSKKASREQLILRKFLSNFKSALSDLLTCPDEHSGWIPYAVKAGCKIILSENVNVIFATGGPWSCLLAGGLLHLFTHIPLALDFRDPWLSNPNIAMKSKISQFIQGFLERFLIKKASVVIANTSELKSDFLRRYGFLNPAKIYTIPNGFETYLRRKRPKNEKFTIVHTGALYFLRDPSAFLEAVTELISAKAIPKQKIEIILIGEIAIATDKFCKLVNELTSNGVVRIVPHLPYVTAQKYQLDADVLLLIQPGFPLQIPRKLYEYMSTGSPILAITDAKGATARIVKEYSLGKVVENEVSPIKVAIIEMYEAWRKGRLSSPHRESVQCFQNSILAQRLYQVLKTASKKCQP